jgi:hypothetical protein
MADMPACGALSSVKWRQQVQADYRFLVAAAESGPKNRHPANDDNHDATDEASKKSPFEKTHYPDCEGIVHNRSF